MKPSISPQKTKNILLIGSAANCPNLEYASGFRAVDAVVLLVTPDREFLINHPDPTDDFKLEPIKLPARRGKFESRIVGPANKAFRDYVIDRQVSALPGGDPLPSHGTEMEGWFWRVTDAASGRVVVVLCGVNRHPAGDWATVAVALHPGGVVRSASLDEARADQTQFALRAGTCNEATGQCEALPTNEGGTCDDGVNCTSSDVCDAGACEGAPYTCDDGYSCTADFCDGCALDSSWRPVRRKNLAVQHADVAA